jgi:hypothetical protein
VSPEGAKEPPPEFFLFIKRRAENSRGKYTRGGEPAQRKRGQVQRETSFSYTMVHYFEIQLLAVWECLAGEMCVAANRPQFFFSIVLISILLLCMHHIPMQSILGGVEFRYGVN